jgi:hypothetical protein
MQKDVTLRRLSFPPSSHTATHRDARRYTPAFLKNSTHGYACYCVLHPELGKVVLSLRNRESNQLKHFRFLTCMDITTGHKLYASHSNPFSEHNPVDNHTYIYTCIHTYTLSLTHAPSLFFLILSVCLYTTTTKLHRYT